MGNVLLALASLLLGSLVTWYVARYYYNRATDDLVARHAVAAMLPKCPVKNSREFEDRVAAFISALERTMRDGRGTPIVREDCTIGVDWSIQLTETLRLRDAVE